MKKNVLAAKKSTSFSPEAAKMISKNRHEMMHTFRDIVYFKNKKLVKRDEGPILTVHFVQPFVYVFC